MKKIVLTGGGTAGHVTPNIALIPELQKQGYEVHYIGSYDGIEKKTYRKIKHSLLWYFKWKTSQIYRFKKFK